MLNKILVPLDGSTLATCVIPHVVALAQVTGATVSLLHVLEPPGLNGERCPWDWQVARIEAELYLNEVKTRLAPLINREPETRILDGNAADRIIEALHEEGTDLAVLSSHGAGGLHVWSLGGLVQKVLSKAGKSVLLVRATEANVSERAQLDEETARPLRYAQIIAPLDGSRRAESVLPVANALAEAHEADLLLAHVVARPEFFERTPLTNADQELSQQFIVRNVNEATAYLQQLRSQLSPEPRITVRIEESVTEGLHRLAEEERCDLIILSAHGRTGDNDFPFGDVVANLIAYGRTPLLILQDQPVHEYTTIERATTREIPGHGVSGDDQQTRPLRAFA